MEKTERQNNIFKKVFAKFVAWFSLIRPLVLMQLKDKIDFSFLKSTKKTIFKIVFSLLGFVVITAVVFFALKLVVGLGLFSFVSIVNFRVYLIVMTLLFSLSFILDGLFVSLGISQKPFSNIAPFIFPLAQ